MSLSSCRLRTGSGTRYFPSSPSLAEVLTECFARSQSWKARLSGYGALIELFGKTTDESDAAFGPYLANSAGVREWVRDSNAVSQEKGVEAAVALVQWAGKQAARYSQLPLHSTPSLSLRHARPSLPSPTRLTAPLLRRARSEVVPSIVEKCLGSARVRVSAAVTRECTDPPLDSRPAQRPRRSSSVYSMSRSRETRAKASSYVYPYPSPRLPPVTLSTTGRSPPGLGPQAAQSRRGHRPSPRRNHAVRASPPLFPQLHQMLNQLAAVPMDPAPFAPTSSSKPSPRSSPTPTRPSELKEPRSPPPCMATSALLSIPVSRNSSPSRSRSSARRSRLQTSRAKALGGAEPSRRDGRGSSRGRGWSRRPRSNSRANQKVCCDDPRYTVSPEELTVFEQPTTTPTTPTEHPDLKKPPSIPTNSPPPSRSSPPSPQISTPISPRPSGRTAPTSRSPPSSPSSTLLASRTAPTTNSSAPWPEE